VVRAFDFGNLARTRRASQQLIRSWDSPEFSFGGMAEFWRIQLRKARLTISLQTFKHRVIRAAAATPGWGQWRLLRPDRRAARVHAVRSHSELRPPWPRADRWGCPPVRPFPPRHAQSARLLSRKSPEPVYPGTRRHT